MNRKLLALLTMILSGLLVIAGTGVASASPQRIEAAEVTGAPAAIIILVILALIVIGIIAVVRFVVRKGKDAL